MNCVQRRPAKKLKSFFGNEEDAEEEASDDEELGAFAGDLEDDILTDDFADGGLRMDEVGVTLSFRKFKCIRICICPIVLKRRALRQQRIKYKIKKRNYAKIRAHFSSKRVCVMAGGRMGQ